MNIFSIHYKNRELLDMFGTQVFINEKGRNINKNKNIGKSLIIFYFS